MTKGFGERPRVNPTPQSEPATDILVVADVHLNGDDPEALETFLAFLRRESSGCGTIIFLGDLFDLWLGPPTLQEPHHRRLADALEEFRRRGIQLTYAEGNRDLFVAHYQGDQLFQLATGGAMVISRGGRRFVLVHGDRLNRIDYNYQAWNKLVRSVAVRLLLRLLPPRLTLRAAATLERKLRYTNRRFRTYFPHAQCEAYAREQFRRGADAVVMGHFHRQLHLCYEDDDSGRGGEVYVLPDWLSQQAALRIGPEGDVRHLRGIKPRGGPGEDGAAPAGSSQ
jgi:UDP-2,3-diacylglucosamine hydrolase